MRVSGGKHIIHALNRQMYCFYRSPKADASKLDI